MRRDILRVLDEAGIGIALATFVSGGLPPLRIPNMGILSAFKPTA